MRNRLVLYWITLALFLPATLVAQEEFQIDYVVSHRMQEGQGSPSITLASPVTLRDATLSLRRAGGWSHEESLGVLARGQRREVVFDQPSGTYGYNANLSGTDEQGRQLTFEFRFEVIIVAPLQVEILVDRVDIGQGLVPIRVNRPIQQIEIEVHDAEGQRLVRTTQDFGGRQGQLDVQWSPRGAVARIQLVVHDEDSFWTAVVLEPFWVEIPHETVTFRTGLATFDDDQEPRLQDSLEKIRVLMAEHIHMDLRLYIAGYTDTVGAAESNLQLSEQRARAIARWFREQGVSIPIFYQGFGQEALAVSTPDETEEAQNRRALYVLGNAPPPTSEQFPRSNWQRVR
jgi:outer membrane protein OmpA-like peptidoglycan-associated protein